MFVVLEDDEADSRSHDRSDWAADRNRRAQTGEDAARSTGSVTPVGDGDMQAVVKWGGAPEIDLSGVALDREGVARRASRDNPG